MWQQSNLRTQRRWERKIRSNVCRTRRNNTLSHPLILGRYSRKSNQLLISMDQNDMWNLVWIFTLVFELARPQKFDNAQTNKTFRQNSYYLEKYNFFDVHLLELFYRPKCHGFAQFFLIKIVSAVLEIFRKKKKEKPHFFHARLQYLIIPVW